MNKYRTVDEFLSDQSSEKRAQINMLREILMQNEPDLEESIKWNAPSYSYLGEDRITFNVMNKESEVRLILHMGASKKENKKANPVLKDDEGMVKWSSDIRGMISFLDLYDIKKSKDKLRRVVHSWLLLKTQYGS